MSDWPALLDRAYSHHPVGIRSHDGTYDPDDMECAYCGEDWPCLTHELATALARLSDAPHIAEDSSPLGHGTPVPEEATLPSGDARVAAL